MELRVGQWVQDRGYRMEVIRILKTRIHVRPEGHAKSDYWVYDLSHAKHFLKPIRRVADSASDVQK